MNEMQKKCLTKRKNKKKYVCEKLICMHAILLDLNRNLRESFCFKHTLPKVCSFDQIKNKPNDNFNSKSPTKFDPFQRLHKTKTDLLKNSKLHFTTNEKYKTSLYNTTNNNSKHKHRNYYDDDDDMRYHYSTCPTKKSNLKRPYNLNNYGSLHMDLHRSKEPKRSKSYLKQQDINYDLCNNSLTNENENNCPKMLQLLNDCSKLKCFQHRHNSEKYIKKAKKKIRKTQKDLEKLENCLKDSSSSSSETICTSKKKPRKSPCCDFCCTCTPDCCSCDKSCMYGNPCCCCRCCQFNCDDCSTSESSETTIQRKYIPPSPPFTPLTSSSHPSTPYRPSRLSHHTPDSSNPPPPKYSSSSPSTHTPPIHYSSVPPLAYAPPSFTNYSPPTSSASNPPVSYPSPPLQHTYHPPPQHTYHPPPQHTYHPPPQHTYHPPSQNTYHPPPQHTYHPPPQHTYHPPPPPPIFPSSPPPHPPPPPPSHPPPPPSPHPPPPPSPHPPPPPPHPPPSSPHPHPSPHLPPSLDHSSPCCTPSPCSLQPCRSPPPPPIPPPRKPSICSYPPSPSVHVPPPPEPRITSPKKPPPSKRKKKCKKCFCFSFNPGCDMCDYFGNCCGCIPDCCCCPQDCCAYLPDCCECLPNCCGNYINPCLKCCNSLESPENSLKAPMRPCCDSCGNPQCPCCCDRIDYDLYNRCVERILTIQEKAMTNCEEEECCKEEAPNEQNKEEQSENIHGLGANEPSNKEKSSKSPKNKGTRSTKAKSRKSKIVKTKSGKDKNESKSEAGEGSVSSRTKNKTKTPNKSKFGKSVNTNTSKKFNRTEQKSKATTQGKTPNDKSTKSTKGPSHTTMYNTQNVFTKLLETMEKLLNTKVLEESKSKSRIRKTSHRTEPSSNETKVYAKEITSSFFDLKKNKQLLKLAKKKFEDKTKQRNDSIRNDKTRQKANLWDKFKKLNEFIPHGLSEGFMEQDGSLLGTPTGSVSKKIKKSDSSASDRHSSRTCNKLDDVVINSYKFICPELLSNKSKNNNFGSNETNSCLSLSTNHTSLSHLDTNITAVYSVYPDNDEDNELKNYKKFEIINGRVVPPILYNSPPCLTPHLSTNVNNRSVRYNNRKRKSDCSSTELLEERIIHTKKILNSLRDRNPGLVKGKGFFVKDVEHLLEQQRNPPFKRDSTLENIKRAQKVEADPDYLRNIKSIRHLNTDFRACKPILSKEDEGSNEDLEKKIVETRSMLEKIKMNQREMDQRMFENEMRRTDLMLKKLAEREKLKEEQKKLKREIIETQMHLKMSQPQYKTNQKLLKQELKETVSLSKKLGDKKRKDKKDKIRKTISTLKSKINRAFESKKLKQEQKDIEEEIKLTKSIIKKIEKYKKAQQNNFHNKKTLEALKASTEHLMRKSALRRMATSLNTPQEPLLEELLNITKLLSNKVKHKKKSGAYNKLDEVIDELVSRNMKLDRIAKKIKENEINEEREKAPSKVVRISSEILTKSHEDIFESLDEIIDNKEKQMSQLMEGIKERASFISGEEDENENIYSRIEKLENMIHEKKQELNQLYKRDFKHGKTLEYEVPEPVEEQEEIVEDGVGEAQVAQPGRVISNAEELRVDVSIDSVDKMMTPRPSSAFQLKRSRSGKQKELFKMKDSPTNPFLVRKNTQLKERDPLVVAKNNIIKYGLEFYKENFTPYDTRPKIVTPTLQRGQDIGWSNYIRHYLYGPKPEPTERLPKQLIKLQEKLQSMAKNKLPKNPNFAAKKKARRKISTNLSASGYSSNNGNHNEEGDDYEFYDAVNERGDRSGEEKKKRSKYNEFKTRYNQMKEEDRREKINKRKNKKINDVEWYKKKKHLDDDKKENESWKLKNSKKYTVPELKHGGGGYDDDEDDKETEVVAEEKEDDKEDEDEDEDDDYEENYKNEKKGRMLKSLSEADAMLMEEKKYRELMALKEGGVYEVERGNRKLNKQGILKHK